MMRYFTLWLAFFLGTMNLARAASDEPPAVWITGDVFTKGQVLFFRTDKPVGGNPMGNVVLLGTTKQASSLLQIYLQAAEKKMKLRLYGSLYPFSGAIPGNKEPLPNVQFITWKVHLPSDPDVLPPGQKVIVK